MKSVERPYQKISIFGERLVMRPYKLSDFKALQESHFRACIAFGQV